MCVNDSPKVAGLLWNGQRMNLHALNYWSKALFLVPAYPGCSGKEAVKWV